MQGITSSYLPINNLPTKQARQRHLAARTTGQRGLCRISHRKTQLIIPASNPGAPGPTALHNPGRSRTDRRCPDDKSRFYEEHRPRIDVDDIDSDLNQQGFPCDSTPPESRSTSSGDSDNNDCIPDEVPVVRFHFDGREHNNPAPLGELYQQLPTTVYGGTGAIPSGQEDHTPELLIALYPHGILQLLLHSPAACATAINVIKCRLEVLRGIDDVALEALKKQLGKVEGNIQNREQQITLLQGLQAFEQQHDIYSLQSKMDADFLVQMGRMSSTLLATPPGVVENNTCRERQFGKLRTWPRVMGWWCKKREYILRGAIRRLATIKRHRSRQLVIAALQQAPLSCVSVARPGISKSVVLNQYIQQQPDTVRRVLTYLVCFHLKYQPGVRNRQAARLVLATDQPEPGPKSIQTLLEQLVTQHLMPDIVRQLEDEIYRHHRIRLEHELTAAPVTTLPALLARRQQILDLESLAGNGTPDTLVMQKNRISAQLIQLFLATQRPTISPERQMRSTQGPAKDNSTGKRDRFTTNQPDLFPPWYFLKQPTVRHIENVLGQVEEGSEKSFYLATLRFIDALSQVDTDNGYERDLHWMQCYYYVAFYQQQLLIHLIGQSEHHPLLPFADFEQNIGALWQLGKARKKMGCLALNPDSYTYYLSYLNSIWQEEETIEDIIAELYRKRYLKQLAYDPCTEFKNLFYDMSRWGSPAIRSIASNAWQLIQRLQSQGSSNVLDTLYQEGNGLISQLFCAENPIHSVITESLATMLEVARQSPAFFRVMWGDFALLMPQLQSLLGQEASITGLLEKIAICLRGQALASLFSGDTPQPLDFDPEQQPRFATFIKRFQLLRDIISALHAGLPVIEIFLCRNVKDLESGLRKVAWNTISTYLARQCVNRIKPPMIRLCNNLCYARDLMPGLSLGVTAGFLASINPDTISLAHHLGRHSSVLTGAFSYLLAPLTNRLGKYKEKVDRVKTAPLDTVARSELKSERKKVAAIFGIASILSVVAIGFINLFKVVVLLGSPVLTAVAVGLSVFLLSGRAVARRYNRFDDLWTSLSRSVSEQMKRTFAKDSPGAIAASKQIHDISKATLDNMAELRQQALSGWNIWRGNKLRIELSKYWHRLQYQDEILQRITTRIRAKRHTELSTDARHLLNFVKARALVTDAMQAPDNLSANPDHFADFNQQLTRLFFLPLDASVLPYQLQYLCTEIDAFLELSCGTLSPGEDLESIINTLEAYNIELHKGDHLFNTLHMRHIHSSLLDTTTDSRPPEAREPADGTDNEYRSSMQLPSQQEAQAILDEALGKCNEQQLNNEQQARKARMMTVNQRALYECLKHYTASSIPNLSTSPLFKANLEIQIRELERASQPWVNNARQSPSQKGDLNSPPHGSTYQAMDACRAFAAG